MRIESERLCLCYDAVRVTDGPKDIFIFHFAHQARCECQSMSISKSVENIKKTLQRIKGKIINGLMVVTLLEVVVNTIVAELLFIKNVLSHQIMRHATRMIYLHLLLQFITKNSKVDSS